ncbi:hypothetical protein Dimus_017354 [Dionaea muscipula]
MSGGCGDGGGGGGGSGKYLSILDAFSAVHQRVSLIGVVLEYSIPKHSKGTDYFCSVRMVDESHYSRGLSVQFFARSVELLPRIEACGDIIVLFDVEMKVHSKEIYALFNKKFSSFALYEGKYVSSFKPYQVSSKFRLKELDTRLVADIRKWLDVFQLDTVSRQSVHLRGIKVGECADLVCKIIHVYEVTKDERLLFVWDGTDAPLLPIQTERGNDEESPVLLQLEAAPLPRDILCTFPTVGTILRVRVDQGNWSLSPSSCTGRWVIFINLTFQVRAGLWCGVCKPFTKIRFVPNEDHLVLKLQRDYEDRVSSRFDRMPFTSFPWPSPITETEGRDVPFVTLLDIITYSEVTAKFKCVARVVEAFPMKAEDFRSPSGTYRLRLTLEDPTARIHAYVYSEDGETFFEGYPSIDEMRRKRNKLLGIEIIEEDEDGGPSSTSSRVPPMVQFCIKSYYVDKSNVWASRRYRIFGTRLIC